MMLLNVHVETFFAAWHFLCKGLKTLQSLDDLLWLSPTLKVVPVCLQMKRARADNFSASLCIDGYTDVLYTLVFIDDVVNVGR